MLEAVLLAAALARPAQAAISNPGTFVYAITGDVDSLDPHWQYDGISHMVMWQVYETLVWYKDSSTKELEALLAAEVPSKANNLISPDGLAYTFRIRKGVKFHDGTPMTPEDVRYSILRCLLMDRAGGSSVLLLEPILGAQSTRDKDGKPLEGLYEAADRAVRVEGGAVVLRMKRPFAPLLTVLATFAPVVSKRWTIAHGGWDGKEDSWERFNNPPKEGTYLFDHVNGTGPFSLERWDRKGKRLVLARNEHYWRKPAALERVIYETVDEPSSRKLQLAAGDADAAMIERQFLPQVAGLDGVAVDDDLPLLEVHNVFVFNLKVNPAGNPDIGSGKLDGDGIPPDFFSDTDVRRGFAHAFDYDAYIRDGYRGKALRARGPIPAGVWGYNAQQPVAEHDLDKAAAHLKKAWGGQAWDKGFKLTVSYMQGRTDRKLACEILKKNLESLNPKFHLDVRGILWSTMLGASVERKLPLVNARWAMDYPDAHNCVHPFLHSEGYYAKLSGYSNPQADRLVDAAVRELDPDKRRQMYRELAELANEDLPAIFTVDTYYLRARRSWVRHWAYNPVLMYGYLYPVSKEE